MQFIIIIIIRGCTFDGVYVPCIYSLVEWEFVYLKFTLDGAEVIYVDLLYVCLVSCTCRADHFSSRRYVHAGKSYAMRSAPSRTMLSTVAFQTVPVPIWLTMPCLFLSERSSSAPGDGRCDVLGFVPVDRVSISSALQQDANNSRWLPGRQCALCFSVSWRLPEERAAPGTGLRPLCRQQGPPPGTPTALHSLMHRNVNCSQSDAERCQLLTVWCREMPTPHNLMQRDANCSQSDAESCQLLTVWCREMPTAYSLMQRNANCLQSDAERCQLLSVWCREMSTPLSLMQRDVNSSVWCRDASCSVWCREMPTPHSLMQRWQLFTVWCREMSTPHRCGQGPWATSRRSASVCVGAGLCVHSGSAEPSHSPPVIPQHSLVALRISESDYKQFKTTLLALPWEFQNWSYLSSSYFLRWLPMYSQIQYKLTSLMCYNCLVTQT